MTTATAKSFVFVPVTTVSESNSHGHWRHRQRRAKAQRTAARLCLLKLGANAANAGLRLPATVKLTRVSPRQLDDDNLRGALKHVRDGVADWFDEDDRSASYDWQYAQDVPDAKGERGVRIEISAGRRGFCSGCGCRIHPDETACGECLCEDDCAPD